MSETKQHDGSQQLKSDKPSNMKTITVRFKQVAVLASGHVIALDEKGFLWQAQGTLEDAIWKQVRQPKIDVPANEGDDQNRGFNRRPGAARFGSGQPQPLTQKLPLGNRA